MQSLAAAAARATYVGSPKHKMGAFVGQVGKPGPNPTTVEQAQRENPAPPFTMICPDKWNHKEPGADATELLRQAIRKGQVGHPMGDDGLPQYVWARDPDDARVVYEARRLTFPTNGYKAYPLIEPQIALIGMVVS